MWKQAALAVASVAAVVGGADPAPSGTEVDVTALVANSRALPPLLLSLHHPAICPRAIAHAAQLHGRSGASSPTDASWRPATSDLPPPAAPTSLWREIHAGSGLAFGDALSNELRSALLDIDEGKGALIGFEEGAIADSFHESASSLDLTLSSGEPATSLVDNANFVTTGVGSSFGVRFQASDDDDALPAPSPSPQDRLPGPRTLRLSLIHI